MSYGHWLRIRKEAIEVGNVYDDFVSKNDPYTGYYPALKDEAKRLLEDSLDYDIYLRY